MPYDERILQIGERFYWKTEHVQDKLWTGEFTERQIIDTILEGEHDFTIDGKDIYKLGSVRVVVADDEDGTLPRLVTVFRTD